VYQRLVIIRTQQMNILTAVMLVLPLVGCATSPADRAAEVQVYNQMSTQLSHCKVLGPVSMGVSETLKGVESTSLATFMGRMAVAQIGGDTLVMSNVEEENTNTKFRGTALRCN